jgi:hypothetical protein
VSPEATRTTLGFGGIGIMRSGALLFVLSATIYCVSVAAHSFDIGIAVFFTTTYVYLFVVTALIHLKKPHKGAAPPVQMSEWDFSTYRKYYLFFKFGSISVALSDVIVFFRIILFIWAAIGAMHKEWAWLLLAMTYHAVAGWPSVMLNPIFYYTSEILNTKKAKRYRPIFKLATNELEQIRRVQRLVRQQER